MVTIDKRLIRRVGEAERPPAVVLGTNITGLALARSLVKHGVPVIGIDFRKRRYTSYSGCFHLLLVEPGEFFGEGLIGVLERLADALPNRAALMLAMDEQVKLLGAHGQGLKDLYHFEFPSGDTVHLLMDKEAFHRIAVERGWPVPLTMGAESLEELTRQIDSLRFPVVLKPRTKNLEFRAHSPAKAFRCSGPEELKSRYEMVAQWEPEVIVQEWIPGGDDQVYFSFHYFDSELVQVASYQGKKIRQYKPQVGNTSSAVGVQANQLADTAREILTTSGCSGFCSVEFKRDERTGNFYVTEPTVGRVNLQVGVAVANGMDIISRAYFHLVGLEYPKEPEPTYDRKWILLWSDIKSARYYINKSEYTWRQYLQSLRGPKSFAVWRVSDYKMMLGFCRVWVVKPFQRLRRLTQRFAAVLNGRAVAAGSASRVLEGDDSDVEV